MIKGWRLHVSCNSSPAVSNVLTDHLPPTGNGTWQDATLVEQHVYRVFMACNMDVMRTVDELSVLFEDD